MSVKAKKENHAKIGRILTYIVLIFLAIISIVPFYNMIIGCTHDNAALATSFQMLPGSHLMDNYKRYRSKSCRFLRGFLFLLSHSFNTAPSFLLYTS